MLEEHGLNAQMITQPANSPDLGGNDYKIPHMKKQWMEHEGTLLTVIKVTDAAAHILEVTNEDNDTEDATDTNT